MARPSREGADPATLAGVVMPLPEFDFEAAWRWLSSLAPRGIQLGLARTEAALERLGNPHEGMVAVTIAGTNGKGSTASFLAAILHEAGYRVGLYTSPHLVSATERIRIGGHTILPRDFARWAFIVREAIEPDDARAPIPLTQFEVLTVMALGYFHERQIDIAVLEVGLGGRLDATNVVPAKVAVLTAIGKDHEQILGNNLRAIAREKVAIAKPGAALVSGVRPSLWHSVVGPWSRENRCRARRRRVDFVHTWLPGGFRYRGWIHRAGPVHLALAGRHQGNNAALACAAAECLVDEGYRIRATDLAEGLLRARHRARLERLEPTGQWPALLIDGAHNPMGARVLARHLAAFLPERPRVLLYGVNPDKDVATMLRVLACEADAIVLTQSEARPVADFAPYVAMARIASPRVDVVAEPRAPAALDLARALAGAHGGVALTGSLYLIGDLLPLIPAVVRDAGAVRLVTSS